MLERLTGWQHLFHNFSQNIFILSPLSQSLLSLCFPTNTFQIIIDNNRILYNLRKKKIIFRVRTCCGNNFSSKTISLLWNSNSKEIDFLKILSGYNPLTLWPGHFASETVVYYNVILFQKCQYVIYFFQFVKKIVILFCQYNKWSAETTIINKNLQKHSY